jgi:hypothetical protein
MCGRHAAYPFQHVEPPGIVGAPNPHVVRHEVDDLAKTVLLQRRDHDAELHLAVQLRVQLAVINDIVAVLGARARL